MRSRLALAVLVAAVSLTTGAFAQQRVEDPEAKKEYLTALAKGESAFVAKDLAGARVAFQDAIKMDAGRMLAIYRLGEVQMAENKLDEAESTLQGALGKKGSNQLKAKVMFQIAVVYERQRKLPQAKEKWNAYMDFIQKNADAKGYMSNAQQHVKVIERRIKDEADYGAVKNRIAARLKEKEAEAVENAKKDKLNK